VDPEAVAANVPPLTSEQLAQFKGKVTTRDGRTVRIPLLSWRVALLPYLGEEKLYKEFHGMEPWDSAHNKKLLARMPKVFAPVGPGAKRVKDSSSTFYQVFHGKDAIFTGTFPARIASISDGVSNTILIAEASEAVPWTKPDDLFYQADKPIPKLGGTFDDGFHAAMADGTVRFIPKDTPEKVLRVLITARSGDETGELPGKDVSPEMVAPPGGKPQKGTTRQRKD
jgi:hypothetical protein